MNLTELDRMQWHWVELNLNQLNWLPFLTLNQVRWEDLCFLSASVSDQPYRCTLSVNGTLTCRVAGVVFGNTSSLSPLPPIESITRSCPFLSHTHFQETFTSLHLCHHNPCPNHCHLSPWVLMQPTEWSPHVYSCPTPQSKPCTKAKMISYTHTQNSKTPIWSISPPVKPKGFPHH